jgi:uncharacterized phage protein gp47/JayE
MPWFTPTLKDVRAIVRDKIRGSLPGADALVPNSVLRVMSDCQGALCHLTLQYIDWLALQLLPDTAEVEWLDRHGDIWLVNADGTTGRKMATLAEGTVEFTADFGGITIPNATQLNYAGLIGYETTDEVVTAFGGPNITTPAPVRALDPGVAGNQDPGTGLAVSTPIPNVTGSATVVTLSGGTDEESDDNLRIRVLERIRQPPQGGAAHDYVRWAKAVPGVTRAWCAPLEMGIGTVTVRVMFDDLRADNDGFPLLEDLNAVIGYIDTVRPVAVKDFWVLAPLKQRIEAYINDLTPDTPAVRAAIETSLQEMLLEHAKPGQTIYAAWKYQAIFNTPDVVSFAMATALDDVMPSPGHMAVLGDIVYGARPPVSAPF